MLKRLMGKWAPHLSAGYSQQDSQEFLRYLLDGLSEDLNNRGGRPSKPADLKEEELMKKSPADQSNYWWTRHYALNNSHITSTFSGQLMSTITCGTCSTKSYCFDPFLDLSVPLGGSSKGGGLGDKFSRLLRSPSFGKKDLNPATDDARSEDVDGGGGGGGRGGDKNSCSIRDCLRAFTSEETIDGDNKPLCCKCKKKRKSTKRIQIHRYPPILVLHLKRFANMRTKLNTRVKFPLTGLDLSEFSGLNQFEQPPVYDLYAISNHIGGLNGGHYTAHCLNEGNGQWYHFNDSHVDSVDAGELCNDGLPYVLFYKRVDV
jgi:ubiquitin carboxyl-terminal hydrolase 2/21